jgi:predicted permease
LVFVQTQSLSTGRAGTFAPADYLNLREQSKLLESTAAAEAWSPVRSGDAAAERLKGLRVSGDLFRLLGVPAESGRVIDTEDDRPGAARVAVVSNRLWQRLLGGGAWVTGRSLRLDGEEYAIVGVMPSGFEFPTFWQTGVDIWAPLQWTPEQAADRDGASLRVFGLLAADATADQALAEVQSISESLRKAFPESHADRGAVLVGLRDETVRAVRPVLLALAAGAGLLWLIALSNVAALAVVRATGRVTETSVRRALGESLMAGMRRDLLESTMLAAAGSAAAVALCVWGLPALLASAPAELAFAFSRWDAVATVGPMAALALAIALIAAITLSLAGQFAFRGGAIVDNLRARAATGASRRTTNLRSFLTGGEVALAVVLTVAAGLVGKSLLQTLAVSPGFNPERVTTAVIPVTGSTYGDAARKAGFYDLLLERLRKTAGIESAAAVNHVPLVGDRWGFSFSIEGELPLPAGASSPVAAYRVATPGYFETIGAHLVEGRDIDAADRRDAPLVVVVNQTFARQYLQGRPGAVKSRVRFGDDQPWREIVGVVADMQQRSWADVGAEVFVPFEQDASFRESPRSPFAMTVVVRSAAGAGPPVPALRRIVADLDPAIPLDGVTTLEQAIDGALWQPRMTASLMSAFGIIGLLLAGIGVYGVAAQTAASRRAELGLRMALGATRQQVLALVLGRSARLVAAGVAAGGVASWLLSDLLSGLLYQVSARDGLVFAGACLALAFTGLAASYLPANRAASVDPATALRRE